MPKASSTKGKHIVHVNVLGKGEACLKCKARKVRCKPSGDHQACSSCLRTARFEGKDLSLVVCEYGQKKPRRASASSSKRSSPSSSPAPASVPESLVGAKNYLDELDRVVASNLEVLSKPLQSSISFPRPSAHTLVSFPDTYYASSSDEDFSYFSDASTSSLSDPSPCNSTFSSPQLSFLQEFSAPPLASPISTYLFDLPLSTSNFPFASPVYSALSTPNPFENSFKQHLATASLLAFDSTFAVVTPGGFVMDCMNDWTQTMMEWESRTGANMWM